MVFPRSRGQPRVVARTVPRDFRPSIWHRTDDKFCLRTCPSSFAHRRAYKRCTPCIDCESPCSIHFRPECCGATGNRQTRSIILFSMVPRQTQSPTFLLSSSMEQLPSKTLCMVITSISAHARTIIDFSDTIMHGPLTYPSSVSPGGPQQNNCWRRNHVRPTSYDT